MRLENDPQAPELDLELRQLELIDYLGELALQDKGRGNDEYDATLVELIKIGWTLRPSIYPENR